MTNKELLMDVEKVGFAEGISEQMENEISCVYYFTKGSVRGQVYERLGQIYEISDDEIKELEIFFIMSDKQEVEAKIIELKNKNPDLTMIEKIRFLSDMLDHWNSCIDDNMQNILSKSFRKKSTQLKENEIADLDLFLSNASINEIETAILEEKNQLSDKANNFINDYTNVEKNWDLLSKKEKIELWEKYFNHYHEEESYLLGNNYFLHIKMVIYSEYNFSLFCESKNEKIQYLSKGLNKRKSE